MSVNHLITGQEWVRAMIDHACMSGRQYSVSDDNVNKSFGYECDACGEVFRITKRHLQNTGPPGIFIAMKQRNAFARKIESVPPGSGLTKLAANVFGTTNATTSPGGAIYNRNRLANEGIGIVLR